MNRPQTLCVTNVDEDGECIIDSSSSATRERVCGNAVCDKNRLVSGVKKDKVWSKVEGPWYEGVADAQTRHNTGWNNAFAFPWEVGMYWNLTTGGPGSSQRAIGCPGLDEPFGQVPKYGTPNWPYRNKDSPIFGSPAMKCATNDYVPEGGNRTMSDIISEFAEDNEFFAEKFMEGWQEMASNGYATELEDGPESSWLGHYSLSQKLKKQGGSITPDFESYIQDNKPVWFTDADADPWICGHRGHASTTCGVRFKEYFAKARSRPECFPQ